MDQRLGPKLVQVETFYQYTKMINNRTNDDICLLQVDFCPSFIQVKAIIRHNENTFSGTVTSEYLATRARGWHTGVYRYIHVLTIQFSGKRICYINN
jgi:hypothetical protein